MGASWYAIALEGLVWAERSPNARCALSGADRADLRRWTEGSRLELSGRPTVFVPPYLCNRLGVARARRLLARTDSVLGRLPGVRNWGGLIAIEGRKR